MCVCVVNVRMYRSACVRVYLHFRVSVTLHERTLCNGYDERYTSVICSVVKCNTPNFVGGKQGYRSTSLITSNWAQTTLLILRALVTSPKGIIEYPLLISAFSNNQRHVQHLISLYFSIWPVPRLMGSGGIWNESEGSHRSQILALIHQVGGETGAHDFIYYTWGKPVVS